MSDTSPCPLPDRGGEGDRLGRGGLAIRLLQGGGEGGFERGRGGLIREELAPEGLPGNASGDLQRA